MAVKMCMTKKSPLSTNEYMFHLRGWSSQVSFLSYCLNFSTLNMSVVINKTSLLECNYMK